MPDDLEGRIRARLGRTDLPAAPDRLRARVVSVVETPEIAQGRAAGRARQGRLLLPLAAVLALAAVIVSTGGPRPRPTASGEPSARPTPAGPVHARLTVNARELEWPCSPGGCETHLDLAGPGGRWTSTLAYADLGRLRPLDPPLPPLLSDGEWTLRADVHVIGDVIYPGENAPRDYGVATTCETTFRIDPETADAEVTLDFWTGLCSAGTTVAADPRDLTTLAVVPSPDAGCGADVGGCDYYLRLSGPGGTWRSVVQTVKPPDQLLTNELVAMLAPGAYRLDAESHRRGEEREVGVGFQEDLGVFASCSGELVVPETPAHLDVAITFHGATCAVEPHLEAVPTPSAGIGEPQPTRAARLTCTALPAFVPSCETAAEAIEASLEPGHPEVTTILFLSLCFVPASQSCGVSNVADVVFAPPGAGVIRYSFNAGAGGLQATQLGAEASSGP